MSAKTNFNFPECWEDDIRMNALFSPFRPKSINPDYYSKKLEFWQTLIYNFCKSKKGCPVFSKQDLEIAFKRKEEHPHCLDMVIEEMSIQKVIQEQSAFFMSWRTWILCKLIKDPLIWCYNIIIPKSNANQYSHQYIHCDLLKQLSNDLLHVLQKHCGKVFSLDDLKETIKNEIFLNEVGLKICLYNLNVQKLIYLDFEPNGNEININLIKIPSKNNPSNKLTEVDRNLQQLKDTRKYLNKELRNTELQLIEYDNSVRKHLREKSRKLAEICLRKKHYIQKRWEKKSDVLFNIEALIAHIEDAHDNGIVLSAFKIGSETLKSLNSKLTLENIDEIMSTMDEVKNNHAELQDSLANLDMVDLNDTNLDKELEELLNEQATSQDSEEEIVENRQNVEDVINQLNNLRVESYEPANKSPVKD